MTPDGVQLTPRRRATTHPQRAAGVLGSWLQTCAVWDWCFDSVLGVAAATACAPRVCSPPKLRPNEPSVPLHNHGALTVTAHATKFIFHEYFQGRGLFLSRYTVSLRQPGVLHGHGALGHYAASTHQPAHLAGFGTLRALTIPKGISGHGHLTAVARAKFAVTSVLSGHGVLSTQITLKPQLTGVGVLTATAVAKQFTETVALSGNGALTASVFASAQLWFGQQTAVIPSGRFTGPMAQRHAWHRPTQGTSTQLVKIYLAATLSGHGVLSAWANNPAATLTGHGVLTATANATQFLETVALTGTGVLKVSAYPLWYGAPRTVIPSGRFTGPMAQRHQWRHPTSRISTPRVTFDAVGAGTTGSLTNPSWLHTIKGNLVVVGIANVTATVTAITCGGVSMTQSASGVQTFSTGDLTFWYLFNPPTGSNITIAATSSSAFVAAGSVSYFNANALAATSATSNFTGSPANTGIAAPTGSMTVCVYANSNSAGSFSAFSGAQLFNDPFSSSVNYPFFIGDQYQGASVSVTPPTSGQDTAVFVVNFTAPAG